MLPQVSSSERPVPPDVLQGPRLDLVLVTIEQLLARAASDGPVPLGFDDPADVLHPDRAPLAYRVPQVLADPASSVSTARSSCSAIKRVIRPTASQAV